mmetsp:Transcript_23753/g.39249  ORF Transcript_23753/g.39249 Transcript_23753/m.39249 type:complete len:208 (-) Transcript_23753:1229-1852(-)
MQPSICCRRVIQELSGFEGGLERRINLQDVDGCTERLFLAAPTAILAATGPLTTLRTLCLLVRGPTLGISPMPQLMFTSSAGGDGWHLRSWIHDRGGGDHVRNRIPWLDCILWVLVLFLDDLDQILHRRSAALPLLLLHERLSCCSRLKLVERRFLVLLGLLNPPEPLEVGLRERDCLLPPHLLRLLNIAAGYTACRLIVIALFMSR